MKKIPVRKKSQNIELWATVDDEDYDALSSKSWLLHQGRALASLNGNRTEMMYFLFPKRKGFVIDHKDRNPLNNQKDNLRYATVRQNIWNSERKYEGKRFVGVTDYMNGYYIASITNNRTTENLGIFEEEEYAARVRDFYCAKNRGEFAVLNLPELPLLSEEEIEIKKLTQDAIRRTAGLVGVYSRQNNRGEVYYQASATALGKSYNLGTYKTQEIAAKVRDCVVLYYMGEFAYLNFPDEVEPLTPDEAKRRFREYRMLHKQRQSPYKGVVNNCKHWQAQIVVGGKVKYIGSYKIPEDAARAYDYAARRMLPEGTFLNFPDVDENPKRTERPRNKKSKFIGVYPTRSKKNPWYAMIGLTGKCAYVGRYKTEEEAAQAYDNAVIAAGTKKGRLNFPST